MNWYTTNLNYQFSIQDSIPIIKFDKPTDLICVARNDTMMITNTTGIFYPLEGSWRGENGFVDWRKAGYIVFLKSMLNFQSIT